MDKIGILTTVERLPSSRNGNPRWLLTIDDIVCRTTPDSSVAYDIPSQGSKVHVQLRESRGKLNVVDIEKIC